jgi:hypothetical protein
MHTVEGNNCFQNCPGTSESDIKISKYKLDVFKNDHKLLNVHLGRCNKIANDAKEAACRMQILEQAPLSTDLTDLEQKSTEGVSSYDLLLSEFEQVRPLRDHVMQKGENMG